MGKLLVSGLFLLCALTSSTYADEPKPMSNLGDGYQTFRFPLVLVRETESERQMGTLTLFDQVETNWYQSRLLRHTLLGIPLGAIIGMTINPLRADFFLTTLAAAEAIGVTSTLLYLGYGAVKNFLPSPRISAVYSTQMWGSLYNNGTPYRAWHGGVLANGEDDMEIVPKKFDFTRSERIILSAIARGKKMQLNTPVGGLTEIQPQTLSLVEKEETVSGEDAMVYVDPALHAGVKSVPLRDIQVPSVCARALDYLATLKTVIRNKPF